jgi:hypothetical protein
MPKPKKWETLSDSAKIEALRRDVTDLSGAIKTIRLDLAHVVSQLRKVTPKK